MVTKYIVILHMNLFSIKYIPVIFYIIEIYQGGDVYVKIFSKNCRKYAKATNTACLVFAVFHQPKMPASMIKKD